MIFCIRRMIIQSEDRLFTLNLHFLIKRIQQKCNIHFVLFFWFNGNACWPSPLHHRNARQHSKLFLTVPSMWPFSLPNKQNVLYECRTPRSQRVRCSLVWKYNEALILNLQTVNCPLVEPHSLVIQLK